MIEEILPNLFRITIPLPDHPLQTMNSYALVSKERSLLIDTGWNRLECAEALLDALASVGVSLNRVDVFLTHIHADHAGLCGLLQNKGAKVFCGEGDVVCSEHYLNSSSNKGWSMLRDLVGPHGFTGQEIEEAIARYPGNNYAPDCHDEWIGVTDNTKFIVGEYSFTAISTPGHTPGHMCLYEADQKLLISGDHLLGEFSPTVGQWPLKGSYLADYVESLDKIACLPVRLILPGHWDTFTNLADRIKAAQRYRQKRHEEIIAVMADNKLYNAYQIAANTANQEKKNAWVFCSITKKWGAVGDTLAELCYLREQGHVKMVIEQGQVLWCKK